MVDEIEVRGKYNEAVTAAEKIAAPETKIAVMLILQMVVDLLHMIEELQQGDDDTDE